MITSIRLPLRTPFGHEQVMIDGLDRVCFFFGPNGSGKTTISQLIADESSLPDSNAIQWDGGNPVRVYVYNRNFITANFANKASVPGVFTMGKGMVDAQKKIDELTEAIERDKSKKEAAQGNLEQARTELQAAQTKSSKLAGAQKEPYRQNCRNRCRGTTQRRDSKMACSNMLPLPKTMTPNLIWPKSRSAQLLF